MAVACYRDEGAAAPGATPTLEASIASSAPPETAASPTVGPATATPSPETAPAPTTGPATATQPPEPASGEAGGSVPGQDSGNSLAGQLPEELIAQRPNYDVSRPFAELVKPHFFAASRGEQLWEVQGTPDLILEWNGKVKIRLKQGDTEQYLDLLALESELIGEHPVHKIFRLNAMGVPVTPEVRERLQPATFAGELFHTAAFEYLPGKEARGVVTEIFPDGTFLVIPNQVPAEWQSNQDAVASPTHFHVNPRALSVRDSALAQEFEAEILALPFDDQRYPPAPLARKQCGVYQESLRNSRYTDLLSSAGYKFTPAQVVQEPEGESVPFGERLSAVLWSGAGEGVRYFGFERYWIADRLRELQAPWIGECDTAGAVRRYRSQDQAEDDFYLTVRRSLEPDKKQRYKIVKLDKDGSGREIYTAPGIMLMALPLPSDDDYWIISAEGWPAPEDASPADPRWQSVYVVAVNRPEEYYEVPYPIAQYPKAPAEGLYGAAASLSSDAKFLFNVLYGFTDEGGGLWVADLSRGDFPAGPEGFSRIVAWDHLLSWIFLENAADGPAPYMSLFVTGKEVADNFAMTASFLRINNAGLAAEIGRQERLLQMVGWNPVPFIRQTLSEHKFRVGVETHFNYESYLLPRAKGVYLVTVDTAQE